MHPTIFINLCTVRIVAIGAAGNAYGTGYYYSFTEQDGTGNTALTIITNKHVIQGADRLQIALNVMPTTSVIRSDGSAEGEERINVEIVLDEPGIFRHPDPNVDLCALSLADLGDHMPDGYTIKARSLHKEIHVSESERELLRPNEPIIMIGYPNGLWDEVNNRPIARQGITASHPAVNWNGRREFLIDAACFGGSSGSPVFLYEDGWCRDGETSYRPGCRIRLLGTLWGGPMLTVAGQLVPQAIPTAVAAVPVMRTHLNLGFVVHASAIDDLGLLVLAAAREAEANRLQ